jgi:hypothetical protein
LLVLIYFWVTALALPFLLLEKANGLYSFLLADYNVLGKHSDAKDEKSYISCSLFKMSFGIFVKLIQVIRL